MVSSGPLVDRLPKDRLALNVVICKTTACHPCETLGFSLSSSRSGHVKENKSAHVVRQLLRQQYLSAAEDNLRPTAHAAFPQSHLVMLWPCTQCMGHLIIDRRPHGSIGHGLRSRGISAQAAFFIRYLVANCVASRPCTSNSVKAPTCGNNLFVKLVVPSGAVSSL